MRMNRWIERISGLGHESVSRSAMTNTLWLIIAASVFLGSNGAPVYIREGIEKGAILSFATVTGDYIWGKQGSTLRLSDTFRNASSQKSNGDSQMGVEDGNSAIITVDAANGHCTLGHNTRVIGLRTESQIQDDYFLVEIDSFEDGADGWENAKLSTLGISSDIFLGGHCKYSFHSTKKAYADLPEHRSVRVTGRVHMLGMWEGQTISLHVDKAAITAMSHHWCPGVFQSRCQSLSVSESGAAGGDQLSKYFSVDIPHTSSNLVMSIVSQLF